VHGGEDHDLELPHAEQVTDLVERLPAGDNDPEAQPLPLRLQLCRQNKIVSLQTVQAPGWVSHNKKSSVYTQQAHSSPCFEEVALFTSRALAIQ
jgi:hypothetical protein